MLNSLPWWQLATRNWRISPGRAAACVIAVAVGVGAVTAINGYDQAAYRALVELVIKRWIGSGHVSVHAPGAHWGTVDASFVPKVEELPNIASVTGRLIRRVNATPAFDGPITERPETRLVDAIGINPETEDPFLQLPNLDGRRIEPGERGVAVIERDTAERWRIGLRDTLVLRAADEALKVRVVGLYESQRLAGFQQPVVYLAVPDLQQLKREPGALSAIDITLEDGSADAQKAFKKQLDAVIEAEGLPYSVETTAIQQELVDQAERTTAFFRSLVAFIVMLTAFFIVVTTIAVSLVQRRTQLGAMRCVGLTRKQLAVLIGVELLPLGLLGTILGLLAGWGACGLGNWWLAQQPIQTLPMEARGLVQPSLSGWIIAICAGLFTTLGAAAICAYQVSRLTPLIALREHAQATRRRVVIVAGLVGVALVALYQYMCSIEELVPGGGSPWFVPWFSFLGTCAHYFGWVLIVPALVMLLGKRLARLLGPLLGLQPAVADASFGRTPWRSAGVCWTLMVGLSMIVYIAVRAESFIAIWDFPATLPDTFVWVKSFAGRAEVEKVRRLPGVHACTALADVDCELVFPEKDEKRWGAARLFETLEKKLSRPVFIAGEPDEVMDLLKIGFAEGTWEEARVKLLEGGHVLIPTQTANKHELHVGDQLTVRIAGRDAEFTIAGVVESAAFEMAVTFFQADSYAQFAAANAVFGTSADLRDRFGKDIVSLFLCDLNLPETPRPSDFDRETLHAIQGHRELVAKLLRWGDGMPNEAYSLSRYRVELEAFAAGAQDNLSPAALGFVHRAERALVYVRSRWTNYNADEDWLAFRERMVLAHIAQVLNQPGPVMGSLRRLTQWVYNALRIVSRIATWLPSIALVVAALGIANLMRVSVHSRSKQIALLRSVGASRGQIIRLILLEAAVLGLFGAAIGVAMGVQQAINVNRIAGGISGFYLDLVVPVATLVLAVAVTVGICLLAGLGPARWAARSNVTEALHAD
jgi:ABC-type lipoprotein release transport system permease subunit